MPRFFVGNLEFEHGLANPHFQISQRLLRLNAELAASWLAVADDGDSLWCPLFMQLMAPFLERLAQDHGLPRVLPVMNWDQVPAGVELVPWGWTDPLIQKARLCRWEFSAPDPRSVRAMNSRRFSFELETEWQCSLPGAAAIRDLNELPEAMTRAAEISSRCVLKAEWGMSARERILVESKLKPAESQWVERRLKQQGVVFLEPWVERLEEIGIQIQIPQLGTPHLVGLTPLLCDEAGQYRGSWFTAPPDARDDFGERWQPAVDIALRAAERMQDRGYFGPLGIDAMRYRLPDGSIRLRPLQDINARWTMGRLSLGWRRFLRPGERGCWWHGTGADFIAAGAGHAANERLIDLTPPWEGDERALRRSWVTFLPAGGKD